MKLLFISGDTALAQGKKGPFYYLLEEFSKYWDRIDIICPKTEQRVSNVHKNVHIHVSNHSLIFHSFFILKKGLEIYKKEKFDIFGVHDYPPFYNDIGGYWLWKRIGVPYVLEIHHITGYPRAGSFKEWFYKILSRLFVRVFAGKAKAIRIVNQKQVPGFLKSSGVSEKKLRYTSSLYIDLRIFSPQEINKRYDLVFAGRLVRNKGIFLLLEAIKRIKNHEPEIKAIIVGSGPLEDEIKNYIKRHKLEKNINFAGWLPTVKDLAKTYNQSKVFVMPSFNEGGPRVNLEAMACRTAVITSKVGVMLDIIKHGENGLFIDWDSKDTAKKILLLLKDDNLRKKIAENGYKTAQQFERKKTIKNYAKTYQNLLYSA
jgi:glycosyltransferase involved in cell wall biosynthesis